MRRLRELKKWANRRGGCTSSGFGAPSVPWLKVTHYKWCESNTGRKAHDVTLMVKMLVLLVLLARHNRSRVQTKISFSAARRARGCWGSGRKTRGQTPRRCIVG